MAIIKPDKARIYKLTDGSILISPSCYEDEAFLQPIFMTLHEYVETVEVNKEFIKNVHNEQVLLNNGVFDIDIKWEWNLMPIYLIRKKHIESLNRNIDLELQKAVPDAVKLMKLNREKEKAVESYPDPSWYEIALVNLDERVRAGEDDKPVIRQKLEEKINAVNAVRVIN